jgi:hypothetical protein
MFGEPPLGNLIEYYLQNSVWPETNYLKIYFPVSDDEGQGVKQGEWLWPSYFINKNGVQIKLTLLIHSIGPGQHV